MPVRYVRDKGSFAAKHVGESAAELRRQWRAAEHTDIVDEFSSEASDEDAKKEEEAGLALCPAQSSESAYDVEKAGFTCWATKKALDRAPSATSVMSKKWEAQKGFTAHFQCIFEQLGADACRNGLEARSERVR